MSAALLACAEHGQSTGTGWDKFWIVVIGCAFIAPVVIGLLMDRRNERLRGAAGGSPDAGTTEP